MNIQEYTQEQLRTLPMRVRKNEKDFKKYLQRLRAKNPKKLDYIFTRIHNEVFERYDCLACANCCKTTSPPFLKRDIENAAAYIGMHPKTFKLQYLQVDEDNDYILKKLPCSFLEDDNKCFIYDNRPKACAGYPHTDAKNMRGLLMVTFRNSAICPAVYEIVEQIKKEIPL